MSTFLNRCRLWWRYGRDLAEAACGTLSQPQAYTKYRLINRLRKQTGSRVFIETGTFRGETAARCAAVFDQVITVELDDGLAASATRRLHVYKNIRVLQGDALLMLPKIFQDPSVHDAFVFLDGHFSGPGTACGDSPEPAADELAVLSRFQDRIKVIVVDDFRCFGTVPGFPSKAALLAGAEQYFPSDRYKLSVQWDQLWIVRRSAGGSW